MIGAEEGKRSDHTYQQKQIFSDYRCYLGPSLTREAPHTLYCLYGRGSSDRISRNACEDVPPALSQISLSSIYDMFNMGRTRYLLANVDTDEQSTMQTMHLPLLIAYDMGPNKTFLAPFLFWQRSILLWTIERNIHVIRKESFLAQHVQRLLHQIRVHHFILSIRRDFHDDMNGRRR